MQTASEKQKYEEAAHLRDKIQAIENITQKQKVSNISENSIDVIGIAKNELAVCIELFFVRGSKMIGREHYILENLKDMETKEILSGFIKEYYIEKDNLPSKIMIEQEIEEEELLTQILTEKAGKKVEIKSPKKGEKLRFVEMAKNNAKITLSNKQEDKYELLTELKEKLGLEKIPKKIETFDISNIAGTNIVARNERNTKRKNKQITIKKVQNKNSLRPRRPKMYRRSCRKKAKTFDKPKHKRIRRTPRPNTSRRRNNTNKSCKKSEPKTKPRNTRLWNGKKRQTQNQSTNKRTKTRNKNIRKTAKPNHKISRHSPRNSNNIPQKTKRKRNDKIKTRRNRRNRPKEKRNITKNLWQYRKNKKRKNRRNNSNKRNKPRVSAKNQRKPKIKTAKTKNKQTPYYIR